MNLYTENSDTEPLRYRLHHSYVDKKKNVKRNVATELESPSINLDINLDSNWYWYSSVVKRKLP